MRGHQGGVCRAMVSRRGQLARVFCEHSAVEGIDLIREHRHLSKEVIATKTITDTTIEVTNQEALRGNVQLKSYLSSNSKKKGASTELRKLSDYEYCHVEVLKEIVTNLLDRFIAGLTNFQN